MTSKHEVNTEYFNGLRDKEKILHVWRNHPISMLRSGLIIVAITLLVVASFSFFGASLPTSISIGTWLVLVPIIGSITWYLWWQNTFVLTNERLIDITYKQPFNRAVAEIPMDIIQDVTYEVKGIVPSMLNFGTVIVQTASYTEVTLPRITDPQAVQQAILKEAKSWRESNRSNS